MTFKEWQEKYYPDIDEDTQAKMSHAWAAGNANMACNEKLCPNIHDGVCEITGKDVWEDE